MGNRGSSETEQGEVEGGGKQNEEEQRGGETDGEGETEKKGDIRKRKSDVEERD